MKWTTKISDVRDEGEIIRGYDLTQMIEKLTFSASIFLILRGKLPSAVEKRMMDALFTAAIDHGVGVASAMSARLVASTRNSLHTAVAAGILAMGELHGSAIEGAARFFQEHKDEKDVAVLVKGLKEQKIRIPGYGHAVLTHDARSEKLFTLAREQGIYGPHCTFAEKVKQSLDEVSSKKLPLNIDGAMGAVLSDMGFDWRMAKGIFIIARVPGLVAHVYEEMTEGEGLRRLQPEETQYTGEQGKSFDKK